MTKEQECIVELYECINMIVEKAARRDMSLFKIHSIGGCDQYQGGPPICRIRDDLLDKYANVIYEAFKYKEENEC